MRRMDACAIDLYWLPVGAATSRVQQASLRLWETIEAARCRRPRANLYHAALKLRTGDGTRTLELAPAFASGAAIPLATGPVGFRGADRFRLFRYQLGSAPGGTFPDEEFAVESPVRLANDCHTVSRVFELAPTVPRYAWGRRANGTREMWTSDSVISWLLLRAGVDLSGVAPPQGGRAPGWYAGIAVASGLEPISALGTPVA